jgi:2-polyprenyl-6-methoxyphenol hydroxylase-like FAD-dependent oxidoreductase
MAIQIEPSKEHPIPYSVMDDETSSFAEELVVSANTHELLEQLGFPPEMDADTAKQTANTFSDALKTQNKTVFSSPPAAFAAREFLRVYGARLAMEMSDVRSALTNKLLELANCGDPKFELKAIELLGKHSDIALFTERSEVTVNYKNSGDLEFAIKERVKRLMNADIVDITPLSVHSLDEELGVAQEVEDVEDVETPEELT